MPLRPPHPDALAALSEEFGFNSSEAELASHAAVCAAYLADYEQLDAMAGVTPPQRYSRRAVDRPAGDANPFGAWGWRTEIATAADGPLTGKRIAIKDNIAIAGVPMMNGNRLYEHFVPETDATVVTRILDAGGEILGKAVCGSLGLHIDADPGLVRNPYDPARPAGGSSGGSAALLAADAVDMAIGGDLGGSIRMPASWCGVFGLKPTHGLVPGTGSFSSEPSLGQLGPMARTARDCAVLLDVIAGPEDHARPAFPSHAAALEKGVQGLRIGILHEAFGLPGSEPDVDAAVRDAAIAFEPLGCRVADVSLPCHPGDSFPLYRAISCEGMYANFLANGAVTGHRGARSPDLIAAAAQIRLAQPHALHDHLKSTILMGAWMHRRHHGQFYAKAHNLIATLRARYDAALAEFDLLAFPSTPMKAPDRAGDPARFRQASLNTVPFNITGHPALSLPCALSEGLPVGLTVVARHGEDSVALRAGHAYEQFIFRMPSPRHA